MVNFQRFKVPLRHLQLSTEFDFQSRLAILFTRVPHLFPHLLHSFILVNQLQLQLFIIILALLEVILQSLHEAVRLFGI